MTTSVLQAWQRALAAEHEAVFGYALLGPRVATAEQALAVQCSAAHEAARNATTEQLAGLGVKPVPPAADYPELYPAPDPVAARRLAIKLEDGCAAAWRYLYLRAASASGHVARSARTAAQDALNASAVRAAQWRRVVTPNRPTTPFPGIH